jgi:hypothetical protein
MRDDQWAGTTKRSCKSPTASRADGRLMVGGRSIRLVSRKDKDGDQIVVILDTDRNPHQNDGHSR